MNRFIVFLLLIATSFTLATVNAPSALTGKGGFTSPTTTKGDLILRNSTIDTRLGVGANGLVLTADSAEATGVKWGSVAGTGDVVGPASATDNALVRFDGATGKAIQNSGTTLTDAEMLIIPTSGGLGIGGTPTSDLPLHIRRDANGVTRGVISNQDAGAGAYAQFSLLSDAGAFNLDNNSLAAGAFVDIRADATMTGGFLLRPAKGPVIFHTNGIQRFSIAEAGTLSLEGATTITTASGSGLKLKDSGAEGVDADPYLTFADGSGDMARFGFLSGASGTFSLSNLVSGGSVTLGTDAATIITLRDSSTGNGANYTSIGNTLRMRGGLFGGASNSDYPYVGYNARTTTTGTAWEYDIADRASLIYFQNGAVRFKQTATVGVIGDPITFVEPFSVSNAGLVTIGVSGGSSVHAVNGDMTVSGLTASRVMVSNGSKQLASSTMTQTILESLTVSQIDSMIEAPSNKTYVLRLNAKYASTINDISLKTASGTITAKLQIDGVDVTGCTAIAVTSTESTTSCSAANAMAAGTTLTLVTSSNSSAVDLQVSVKETR